ncbi:MAG TPA: phosphotransferase [Rhizomicrobium sp.]|nr:phosphotransferase [Rhizomicrobium sp.]
MSIGLIASAAYINQEMAAEFGPLPPAFLPLGNARLFCIQADLLRRIADRVFLSLPQSFRIRVHDSRLLADLGVTVVRIPDGLTLADSLMVALAQCPGSDEQLYILHGDTLFLGLKSFPSDGLSVHADEHPYPWAQMDQREPVRLSPVGEGTKSGVPLVSGLFAFSDGAEFLRCLGEARSGFLAAINLYAARCPDFDGVENCGQWLDVGHLNTYYASRRTITTERAFNNLTITHHAVCKTSAQAEKMDAEAFWYENLPPPLKGHVPAFLGRTGTDNNRAGYYLRYEYLCPLSDLFVFGAVSPDMWRQILSSCADVLAEMRAHKPRKAADGWFSALYRGKTLERFQRFARDTGIDPDHAWTLNGRPLPAPKVLIEEMADIVGPPGEEDAGILHGDFCFSNILYDFRRGSVTLIDPRGFVEPGKPAIFGDTRYDVGKLHHSVLGRYDFILAGYFALKRVAPYAFLFEVSGPDCHDAVERVFRERICDGDPARERVAGAISVLLHLSMLPLHAEAPRRQLALLANGYRLYQQYFTEAA